jgi:(2Fe-2S) ferredoxin
MQTDSATQAAPVKRRCVLVCQHRSCERNGAIAVLAAFRAAKVTNVLISASDCLGQCASGPTVQVMPDQVWYCRVQPDDVPLVVEQHLHANQPVAKLLHPRFHPQSTE